MRNESIIKLFEIIKGIKLKDYSHLFGMPYNDQLKTKEWKYFRLYVILVKGFKCELCDDKNFKHFQVHHKKYIKGLLAWQYELADLMVLCGYHHAKVHKPVILEKYNRIKSIKNIYNG